MAFKALAAHNWHVRDAKIKGWKSSFAHSYLACNYLLMSALMAVKWNWSELTTPEAGAALLSDISHAVGYFISL